MSANVIAFCSSLPMDVIAAAVSVVLILTAFLFALSTFFINVGENHQEVVEVAEIHFTDDPGAVDEVLIHSCYCGHCE